MHGQSAPSWPAQICQLHRGDFIDCAGNDVLVSEPGTGKTHIAAAIVVHAVAHLRKKVRLFFSV
ncbi:MAG: ATP-binding protein [Acetobacteraceae bacterium]